MTYFYCILFITFWSVQAVIPTCTRYIFKLRYFFICKPILKKYFFLAYCGDENFKNDVLDLVALVFMALTKVLEVHISLFTISLYICIAQYVYF